MKKFRGLMHALKYYCAILIYSLIYRNKKNKIWLIGENLGTSACDNGYYFFKYLKEERGEKEAFFVYDPRRCDLGELQHYRKSLVQINSFKHFLLYFQSQYLIVSHGIRDAKPVYIHIRKKGNSKPIIYLQHGVIKFKKIPFTRMSYDKSILRFLASSEEEKRIICNQLMSKKDQHDLNFLEYKLNAYRLMENASAESSNEHLLNLINYVKPYNVIHSTKHHITQIKKRIGFTEKQVIVTGLSRYDSLLEEDKRTANERLILLFPTWRDNLKGVTDELFTESRYFKSYSELLGDNRLKLLLEETGYQIELYLHTEMKQYNPLFESLVSENIKVCTTNNIRSLIVKSTILITDYSSIAWEFATLGKEVMFYHFDKEDYESQRASYCNDDKDWCGKVCTNAESLITSLSNSIETPGKIKKLNIPNNCNDRIFNEIKSIPKKVYFLVYNIYGVGGTVKTVINTANYLYNKGYDVEIISTRRTSEDPKLPLEPGIKISPLFDVRCRGRLYKKKTKSLVTCIFNLVARVTCRFKSRLIHQDEDLYNGFSVFTDLMIIKKLIFLNNCNLVTTIPSFNIIASRFTNKTVRVIGQEHKFFKSHSDALQREIIHNYSKLNILTVLTDDDHADYSKIIDKSKVIIQPNGTEIGSNNGLSEDRKKKIISLARFVPQKRLDLLIASFAHVVAKEPECTLEIYGYGPLKDQLINQIKDLNLEKHILINEQVADITSVLKTASVFALSSDFEPFGMVIIEANAHGLPVVSFDIPYGPRSLIEDGVTGLKAQSFDTRDYADKILKLVEDIEFRNTLSENAYQYILERYSNEVVGEKFAKLLD